MANGRHVENRSSLYFLFSTVFWASTIGGFRLVFAYNFFVYVITSKQVSQRVAPALLLLFFC